jgi:chromosome partitioning protein
MSKLPRHKKLVFFNNKGGVGKTTIAFHTAVKLSEKGLRVALIDLDPQCNLTMFAMGEDFFKPENISKNKNAYNVIENCTTGKGDVDFTVPLIPTKTYQDILLLAGSIQLSLFETDQSDCISKANSGKEAGFRVTSAFARFLDAKAKEYGIDIFIMDCSPSFGVLNQVILLSTDYFIVPLEPDCFSVQGVENLGGVLAKWKRQWKVGAIAQSKEEKIPADIIIQGDPLFVGYVINRYNPYAKNLTKPQKFWFNKIPQVVDESLSKYHTRNGLSTSTKKEIGLIKAYNAPLRRAQKESKCVFDLTYIQSSVPKSAINGQFQQCANDFKTIADYIEIIANKY